MARYRAVVGDIRFEPEDKDDVHLVAKLELLPGFFSEFGKEDKDEREAVLGLLPLDRYANYDERYSFIKMLRYARDAGLEVIVEGDKGNDLILRNAVVTAIKNHTIGKAHYLTQDDHIHLNPTTTEMVRSMPENTRIAYKNIDWIVDSMSGKTGIEPVKGNLEIFTVRESEQYKALVSVDGYTKREEDMFYTLLMFGEDRKCETRLRIIGKRKGPIISPARISNIYIRGRKE